MARSKRLYSKKEQKKIDQIKRRGNPLVPKLDGTLEALKKRWRLPYGVGL
jgi:hypothetical protein